VRKFKSTGTNATAHMNLADSKNQHIQKLGRHGEKLLQRLLESHGVSADAIGRCLFVAKNGRSTTATDVEGVISPASMGGACPSPFPSS
jgi:hypothetical protein